MSFLKAGLLILSAFLAIGNAAADQYSTLYGFKIGQSLGSVKHSLGEPTKVIPFDDGWVAYAYREQNHNVIFETHPSNLDLIISIQIEGEKNPDGYGLGSLNLGASVADAKKQLGAPSTQEESVDSSTGKPVAGVYINRYGESLSFEESAGRVSSIKISYGGHVERTEFKGLEPLLKAVKANDYYAVCQLISPDLTIQEEPGISGQILESVKGGTKLNQFLFGKDGLVSIGKSDKYETAIRVSEGGSGYVLKFHDKPFEELVFVETFQGWVLKEVW